MLDLLAAWLGDVLRLGVGEGGEDDEDRVRPVPTRLMDLRGVDEEVLAQQRQVRRGAHTVEDV